MQHGQVLLVFVSVVLAAGGERVVEHEVDIDEALRVARSLRPDEEAWAPGCAECSPEEESYCLSYAVLHDHCCCDMKYDETFPFVPHTCYLSNELCSVLAGDCDIYTRRRVCCCDHLLQAQWRALARSSGQGTASVLVVTMGVLAALLRFI